MKDFHEQARGIPTTTRPEHKRRSHARTSACSSVPCVARGNLFSEHGEPGTPGYPRSGSWVWEAGYPLAGVALPQEGATRAPGVAWD